MKKALILSAILSATLLFADSDIKVYRDGEAPSVEELKAFFEASKESTDGANSRLGKSKGLTIGGKPKAKAEKEISLPIKFANNSYEIENDPNTMQILNNIKQALQTTSVTLVVEGHTNAVGSKGYNYELSKKRAQAVKQFLVQHGVNGNTIITKGRGFESPLSGTDPKDADNRRVQFKVAN